MANLTITASDVTPVEIYEQITAPAGEAISAGQYVRVDGTSGKLVLGSAVTGGADVGNRSAIAINSAAAGETLTAVRRGLLDVGDALDALSFDDPVYLSDTEGTLADAAGTVSKIVGHVAPAWAATTPDKLLLVDL